LVSRRDEMEIETEEKKGTQFRISDFAQKLTNHVPSRELFQSIRKAVEDSYAAGIVEGKKERQPIYRPFIRHAMITMTPSDETIYPESSIAQNKVGKLEVETMAHSTDDKIVEFTHLIRLFAEDGGKTWGKLIFAGSLKDLIRVVLNGTETEEERMEWAAEYCRHQGWTEPG